MGSFGVGLTLLDKHDVQHLVEHTRLVDTDFHMRHIDLDSVFDNELVDKDHCAVGNDAYNACEHLVDSVADAYDNSLAFVGRARMERMWILIK